jgi:imidazolonepropionase
MLIKNIKSLVQVRENNIDRVRGADMQGLPCLDNSYLQFKGDKIISYGSMAECPASTDSEIIDASGQYVLPSFVDSHSHIIFAETREAEFVDKIKGASYAEIAAKGGGILNSAKKLQQTSEDELFEKAMLRVNEVIGFGTGCLEIKSGYGLTTKDELKMLRVARRIGKESPLTVKTTFLGYYSTLFRVAAPG